MELNLSLDRRNIARFRTLLRANRTMAAKALTQVAYKARDAWRGDIPSEFHLRRKWLVSGIRVGNATAGNLTSRVGSLDKFFGRHVKGVDEPKNASGGRLFVPAQPIEKQGTHTQIRAMLRRADSTKRKTFVVGDTVLRRKGKARLPLIVMGRLRKSVNIQPRFDALAITERAVRAGFETTYSRLLKQWAETGRG